jgi:hypothetical protein
MGFAVAAAFSLLDIVGTLLWSSAHKRVIADIAIFLVWRCGK